MVQKKNIVLYKTAVFAAAFVMFLPHYAYAQLPPCRSEIGGHCVVVDTASPDAYALHSSENQLAQTAIPGLEFLNVTSKTPIGDVLVNLYTFGIALVAIAAFVVVVGAGIFYITAGDSKSRVDQAKEWIQNAVFGLVLALVSWLILFTINPDLIKALSLENLEKITQTGDTIGGDIPE